MGFSDRRKGFMAIAVQEAPAGIGERPMIVNNFTINIATVNGSGS
jgi:hypothetical protein